MLICKLRLSQVPRLAQHVELGPFGSSCVESVENWQSLGVVVHEVILWHAHEPERRSSAHPPADLDAHIGAKNVVEPRPVEAANLHVLDRLGLDGKIGRLSSRQRDETRRAAKEKAFKSSLGANEVKLHGRQSVDAAVVRST